MNRLVILSACFFSIVGLLLLLIIDQCTDSIFKTVIRVQRKIPAPLRILIWGPPHTGSWIPLPAFSYGGKNCPCYFTKDYSQVDDADVVVFAAIATAGNYSQLPPISGRRSKLPHLRVFVQLESPQRMYGNEFKHLPNNDQFNWTMTYRLDSDVPFLYYGKTTKKDGSNITDAETEAMANHTLAISQEKLESYKTIYLPQNKTKQIAWVVSNCDPMSRSGDLVKELQKFVKVDIYGKCGDLKCPDDCKKMIGKNYKFYLAFENSLCYDYITEKFFNALDTNIIPIVYGGANYSRLAPPGSYINVMDFPSLKQLTEYIDYLDKTPGEYLKYFLWKEHFFIYRENGWCELCWKLVAHSAVKFGRAIVNPNYFRTYRNISAWLYFNPLTKNGDVQELACRPAIPLSFWSPNSTQ